MLRSLEFQVGALFELMDAHTSLDVADSSVAEVIDRKRESLAETFDAVKEALWWQQRRQRQSRARPGRELDAWASAPSQTPSGRHMLVPMHTPASTPPGSASTNNTRVAPPIAGSGLQELEALHSQLARRVAAVVEDGALSEYSGHSSHISQPPHPQPQPDHSTLYSNFAHLRASGYGSHPLVGRGMPMGQPLNSFPPAVQGRPEDLHSQGSLLSQPGGLPIASPHQLQFPPTVAGPHTAPVGHERSILPGLSGYQAPAGVNESVLNSSVLQGSVLGPQHAVSSAAAAFHSPPSAHDSNDSLTAHYAGPASISQFQDPSIATVDKSRLAAAAALQAAMRPGVSATNSAVAPAHAAAPGLRPEFLGGLPWTLPQTAAASSANTASPVPSGNSISAALPPAVPLPVKGEALQGTALRPLVLTPTVYHYRGPD